MGAFFIYKKENNIDLQEVKNVFDRKQFKTPLEYEFNEYNLILYQKTLVDRPNFLSRNGAYIFSVGSFTYKALNYSDSLNQLLIDFLDNSISYNELIGHYCLIFYNNSELSIIRDALRTYHLFCDNSFSFISSSYISSIYAFPEMLTINKFASYENFLTGYISGNETHFNEIFNIDDKLLKDKFKWINNLVFTNNLIKTKKSRNIKASIEIQKKGLIDYFKRLDRLIDENKMQIGLSSGYDSRLLYAISMFLFPKKTRAYTHYTKGVPRHSIESEIVTNICKDNNTPLKSVLTKRLNQYSKTKIDNILIDGFYFFDGRCTDWMGALSETYTYGYRKMIFDGSGILLNGLGGEIYRNHYKILLPIINFKNWLRSRIYPPQVFLICKGKRNFEKVHGYIVDKINEKLNENYYGYVSRKKIAKYYSYFKLEQCDALVANANNQHSFYFIPFIEKQVIDNAYMAWKHIGFFSAFHIKLISNFNPKLNDYMTNYGYKLSRIPIKEKVKNFIRGITSSKIIILISKLRAQEGEKDYYESIIQKSDFFKNADNHLQKLFNELNLIPLRNSSGLTNNMAYTAVFFYLLKDKISEN